MYLENTGDAILVLFAEGNMKNKLLNTFHVSTPEEALEHGVLMELTDGETVLFQFMWDGRILTNPLRTVGFVEYPYPLETIQRDSNSAVE